MTQERIVYTDKILVEFTGSLPDLIQELSYLERGFRVTYPPEDHLWWDSNQAVEEYQTLIDRLTQKAPSGYSFKGHHQQPQCFGYWPND